ncbi:MAG TPA: WhiB family transcriptional regulator [Acidimicrobiales bacterium]|nr:WhiB family transcriptional regulator [Acidimicrobiales bacterium]
MIAGERLAAGMPGPWADEVPCRGQTALFFPPAGTPAATVPMLHRQAKAICRTCSSRQACLEFALETQQPDGIWGGFDADELRGIRHERGQATRRAGSGAIRG